MSVDLAFTMIRDRIDASDQKQDERFNAIDKRLDDLTEQVRVANGRTRANELGLAGLQPRVETLRHELSEAKNEITALKKPDESGENRTIRAWHIYAAVAIVAATVTVLAFLGKLHA